MGLSVLYSPFFFAAHSYALLSDDYPASGYSRPYHVALEFSSLFYLIFGLLVLRKILLRYFSELVTAITILITGLATNLFSYTTMGATMPHSSNSPWSFFLSGTPSAGTNNKNILDLCSSLAYLPA